MVKGKKSYKNSGEKKATLESSQKCVNGLFRNLSDIYNSWPSNLKYLHKLSYLVFNVFFTCSDF